MVVGVSGLKKGGRASRPRSRRKRHEPRVMLEERGKWIYSFLRIETNTAIVCFLP